MAEFGSKVTGMSQVDPSIGRHITPGVEDKSAAILMGTIGKVGEETYKGYQLADVEKNQEQVISDYMDRTHPEQLTIETGGLKKDIDSIWGSLDATIEEVNPIEKQFQSNVARLKSAVDQGVMSPAEFSNRTLTVLREAVNKNPGLMAPLAEHAQKVLELSGIQGIVKNDELLANQKVKDKNELESYYRGIAKDLNIPLTFSSNGAVDYGTLINQVSVVQKEKGILDSANRQTDFTENDFRAFGPQYATGKINEATDLAIKTLSDPTLPYDKAILQTNLLLDSVAKGFNSDPRVGKIIDKPSVVATSKYIDNSIAAIKKNLTTFSSKEDAATYLKNTTNILRDQQYQDMSKIVNPQMLDMVNKLAATTTVADFISKQPELKVELYNAIKNITDGLPTNSVTLYQDKTNPINKFVDFIAKEAGQKNPPASSILGISNAIKSVDTDLSKLDPSSKFNFYSGYIKTLGNPTNKEGLSKLDDDSRSRATIHVNNYANITLTNMKEILDKTVTAKDNVVFSVLPDGRLTVSSNNPTITNEMNSKFIPRINDSIFAISNLSGHGSTKDAAKEFYNTHKQFFIGGK